MPSNVKITVPKDLNPRCTASGVAKEKNLPAARAADRGAIGDDRRSAGCRGAVELRGTANAPLAVPPLFVNVPLAAVEVSWKNVWPPLPPEPVPPLLVKVPLAAVEAASNNVRPPSLTGPAEPLLIKVPLPAVEVFQNCVEPALNPTLDALALFVKVPLHALEES